MDFLTDNYGCRKISDDEFATFMGNNGIGYTNEQRKASINTQAWILHFTNPAEAWANVRRSGYPRLKSPADYGFGQFLTGGQEIQLDFRIRCLSHPITSLVMRRPYSVWVAAIAGIFRYGGMLINTPENVEI